MCCTCLHVLEREVSLVSELEAAVIIVGLLLGSDSVGSHTYHGL